MGSGAPSAMGPLLCVIKQTAMTNAVLFVCLFSLSLASLLTPAEAVYQLVKYKVLI